jgi:hypothetical protein
MGRARGGVGVDVGVGLIVGYGSKQRTLFCDSWRARRGNAAVNFRCGRPVLCGWVGYGCGG